MHHLQIRGHAKDARAGQCDLIELELERRLLEAAADRIGLDAHAAERLPSGHRAIDAQLEARIERGAGEQDALAADARSKIGKIDSDDRIGAGGVEDGRLEARDEERVAHRLLHGIDVRVLWLVVGDAVEVAEELEGAVVVRGHVRVVAGRIGDVAVGVARAPPVVGRAGADHREVELHELGRVVEPAHAEGCAHVGPERQPLGRVWVAVVGVGEEREVGRVAPPRGYLVLPVVQLRLAQQHVGARPDAVAVARDEVGDVGPERRRLDEP